MQKRNAVDLLSSVEGPISVSQYTSCGVSPWQWLVKTQRWQVIRLLHGWLSSGWFYEKTED